jgi:hypothetical protein
MLRTQDLKVESFEVQPAATGAALYTQQIVCLSPYCAPTAARTCYCAAAHAAEA